MEACGREWIGRLFLPNSIINIDFNLVKRIVSILRKLEIYETVEERINIS